MSRSLRWVLLTTLLPTVTLIWALTAALSYQDARDEIGELLDAEMAQSARFLLALADSGLNPDTLDQAEAEHIVLASEGLALEHKYEKKLVRQIWQGPHTRLLLRTADAPLDALSSIDNGYSLSDVAGVHWHVYTLGDQTGRFIIHIGQSSDVRERITDDITRDLLLPYLIGIPLIAGLISLGISWALRPLRGLVREVEKRGDDLLTPLTLTHLPREVEPLVYAFNKLLCRLRLAFDNERRFTADAAHELRTPLAGIQTQTDVALRAHDEATRNNALRQIKSGVQRTDHLIGQLLILARLDPEAGLLAPRPLEVGDAVLYAVGELDDDARAKNQSVELDLNARQSVPGHLQMLEILTRNLLDNAIRYTPAEGRIRIVVEDQPEGVCLCVDDSGPGIPEAVRQQVFARFYRHLETVHQQTGSGLGLSIVERIVRLHGARIELDQSEWGGLSVRVTFKR